MSQKKTLVIHSDKLYLYDLIEGQFIDLQIFTKSSMENSELANYDIIILDLADRVEISWKNGTRVFVKPLEAKFFLQSLNNVLLLIRSIIIKGDIKLNKMLKIIENDGKIYKLTEKETDFLFYLMEQKATLSKEAILRDIWGYKENVDSKTLETHIYKLKKKIPFFDFSFL
jgi:DNA-binding response OmpR family regulator